MSFIILLDPLQGLDKLEFEIWDQRTKKLVLKYDFDDELEVFSFGLKTLIPYYDPDFLSKIYSITNQYLFLANYHYKRKLREELGIPPQGYDY